MNKSNHDSLTSLLGFAQKSGNVSSGSFAVLKSIDKNRAKLVIIAEDISENSIKKIREKCNIKKIPIIKFATKDTLGHYIGKELRAVISINNDNFAENILKKWEGGTL